LRVIVPGYIGARSVKWLASIIVQPQPSSNYFQAHAYRLFPPHIQSEQEALSHPGEGCMLGELPLNSVICTPHENETRDTGEILVEGYALTGTGSAIERVELSLDGGASWIEAKLDNEAERWAWRFWEARLSLAHPGAYELVVRAWDSSGRTQPANLEQIWNYKGYMNSAWHRVHITLI
jgi:sulfite oxidase